MSNCCQVVGSVSTEVFLRLGVYRKTKSKYILHIQRTNARPHPQDKITLKTFETKTPFASHLNIYTKLNHKLPSNLIPTYSTKPQATHPQKILSSRCHIKLPSRHGAVVPQFQNNSKQEFIRAIRFSNFCEITMCFIVLMSSIAYMISFHKLHLHHRYFM